MAGAEAVVVNEMDRVQASQSLCSGEGVRELLGTPEVLGVKRNQTG